MFKDRQEKKKNSDVTLQEKLNVCQENTVKCWSRKQTNKITAKCPGHTHLLGHSNTQLTNNLTHPLENIYYF